MIFTPKNSLVYDWFRNRDISQERKDVHDIYIYTVTSRVWQYPSVVLYLQYGIVQVQK